MEQVRELYESRAAPVWEIAQIAGVAERTLYKHVRKGGWQRRQRYVAHDGTNVEARAHADTAMAQLSADAVARAAQVRAEMEEQRWKRIHEQLWNSLEQLAEMRGKDKDGAFSETDWLAARLQNAIVAELEALMARRRGSGNGAEAEPGARRWPSASHQLLRPS